MRRAKSLQSGIHIGHVFFNHKATRAIFPQTKLSELSVINVKRFLHSGYEVKAGTFYGLLPLWQCAGSLQPTAPRSSERESYFKLIWILEETQIVDLHPGYIWRWPPWSCKTNLSNSSASKYFSMPPSSAMPLNANRAAAILIDGQKFTTLTLEPS